MRRVRLVLADRRPIVLQGFVSLFGAQPDFEVVSCCLDGANCLASIRRLTPDVVLLEDGFTDVTASDILAVMTGLAVRNDVVGADQIQIIDLCARHKLVNLDGAGRIECDVLQLVLGHFEIAVLIDLIAFDDVFIGHLFAGVGVYLKIANPVPGLLIDLVETDNGDRPHSSLKYLTPAAYAATFTATGDRLRNPDQLRRSPVAPPAPIGVQPNETLTVTG